MFSTEFITKRKSLLERALSIFAEVRNGEGLTALLMMMNVFTLLTAYYIIKPVREALILGGAGAEIKSYAGAGQALLFLLLVPAYSAFASRVNRVRLINGVTLFFISNLVIFYALGRSGVQFGVAFFLWVGLFNLMVLAQFWAFANDIYTQEQGRRLFAVLGIGSSVGAIFGARIAGWLFKPLGPYSMMLVSAGLLGVCVVLTNIVHNRERGRAPALTRLASRAGLSQSERLGPGGGFQLVLRHRYLLFIALLVLLENFVNTTGEFILGKTVTRSLHDPTAIGEFYAGFFFWVNVAGAALQMFLVSRIMKYAGIGPALFVLPAIALVSYGTLIFLPVLGFIRIAKIAENSADYSIQNTARHALFLRTDRAAKYKAKSAIDSFFWRAGDALSALLVFLGTQLTLGVRYFAAVNALLVLIWVAIAYAILRIRKEGSLTESESRAA